MYIPKRYGQSKVDSCPFCDKQATAQNNQGIPVCQSHKDQNLDNLKCVCGSFLEVKSGKFGPYFYCFKCGNMNFRKGLEINATKLSVADYKHKNNNSNARKEITVRSDELDD